MIYPEPKYPKYIHTSEEDKEYKKRLKRFHIYNQIAIIILIIVPVMVILGWLMDIPILTGYMFGFKATQINTATCFLMAAVAILLIEKRTKKTQLLGNILAIFIFLMGSFTIIEYLSGYLFSIDIFSNVMLQPFRSRILSSIILVLFGISLLTLYSKPRLSQSLAFMGGFIAFTGFTGYILSSNDNYFLENLLQMAFLSSILHIILSIGLLTTNPKEGFISIVISSEFGGYTARRLLPAIVTVLFILTCLVVWGENIELFGNQYGEVILVTLSVAIFTAIIILNAYRLNKIDRKRRESSKKIISLQKFYISLVEGINEGIWVSDENNVLYYMNRRMAEISGVVPDKIVGKNILTESPPYFREMKNLYIKAKESLKPVKYDSVKILNPKGKQSYQSGWMIPQIDDGKFVGIICSAIDDTQRKKAEIELKESENKYRQLIQSARDNISIVDENGDLILYNPSVMKTLGYEGLMGKNLQDIFPETGKEQIKVIRKVIDEKQGTNAELKVEIKDKVIWFSNRIDPIMNSDGTINTVQIISRDITDLKEAEEAVKKSLEDKEMLLREIHHRVKNNMQIISSLLNLQRSYIQDPNTDSILQESQDRVKSMAMVHEKLYETPELSHINVDDYIRKLTQNLFLSYRVQSGINLEMNFDDIYISTDTAIPLGLLINELVSNSLKHAFVGRDHGTITISVSEIENGYQLMVGDNGWGIPEGFDYTQTDTLGLQLVNSLLDQINGTLFLETGKGTKFIIRFSELNYPKRH